MKIIGYLIVLLFLCATACKSTYPSAEVSYIDNTGKDILILEAKGYGNNKTKAMNDAEKRAFETLFFRGIPNSTYRFGMMPNEEHKQKRFLQGFFITQKHREFITASTVTSSLTRNKQKKTNELAMQISINTLSLSKYLEQEKVVHKFGF